MDGWIGKEQVRNPIFNIKWYGKDPMANTTTTMSLNDFVQDVSHDLKNKWKDVSGSELTEHKAKELKNIREKFFKG